MKQNVALSILTPFSSKSAKKWEGATPKKKKKKKKKNELDGGGPRGVWKLLFMLLF